MSSEFHTLDELHQRILRLLMSGWQTNEQAKSHGVMRLHELVPALGAPEDELRHSMTLLETLGYVVNLHAAGGDPTMVYKELAREIDPADRRADDPLLDADPGWYISESGKRLVLAGSIGEDASAATT